MSTDPILVFSLIGMFVALVVIHLTFRNALNAREALFTPAVFAACGALTGISIGMIGLSDREGRVTIDKGILLVVCGTILGALAGAGAKQVYSRLNRGRVFAFVLMMTLIGGSIGSPLGWIKGSLDDMHEDGIRSHAMLLGVAAGSGIGLILGLFEVILHRRGAA